MRIKYLLTPFLTLIFASQFGSVLNAQILSTPFFHENLFAVNPASLGALSKDGIRLNSLYNTNRGDFGIVSFGGITINRLPSLVDVLPRSNEDRLGLVEYKSLQSLSYHTTQELSDNLKITVGLQMQTVQNRTAQISSPSTFGITANLHKTIEKTENKVRYFSFGLQMNLINTKPIKVVSRYAYDNLIDTPIMDYNTFHRQFARTGFQYQLGANYLKHKLGKSIFAFGLTLNVVERKTPFSFASTGSFTFRSQVNFTGALFFNYQRALGEKFMIDINSHADIRQRNLVIGTGYRLKKNRFLRIQWIRFSDSIVREFGMSLGIDIDRFSYRLFYAFDAQNLNSFDLSASNREFFQLGANYRLNGDTQPRLLNIKY